MVKTNLVLISGILIALVVGGFIGSQFFPKASLAQISAEAAADKMCKREGFAGTGDFNNFLSLRGFGDRGESAFSGIHRISVFCLDDPETQENLVFQCKLP